MNATESFTAEKDNALRCIRIYRETEVPLSLGAEEFIIRNSEWAEFVQFVLDQNAAMPESTRWVAR